MQREAVAHPEQRVHVPAEAQDPRALGDLLVHRRVAVDGHHLEVGVDAGPPQLRPRALAGGRRAGATSSSGRRAGGRSRWRTRWPSAAIALDVVADVGRRAVGARVAVVDDRERRAVLRRRRRGGGVAVGLHPRAHPLDLTVAVTPRGRVLVDVALEHGEHLAGEVLVAVAEHRREDVEPRLGADRLGVLGDERADLVQRGLRVHLQPAADVLDRRVPEPEVARRAAQLDDGELEVVLLVGDDPADEVAEVGGLGASQQPLGDRDGRIGLVGRK